ncbi:MFS transporter [Actinoplanes sp. KI2]|uniref:MFS transporter n=1 Tax=Actinoplanes sp. KI2 TaxID=2983315 RepID=UPI0021D60A66|nr:MFS transporter [Actinoplanes sp. KI2]MCU7725513.1 MFS transporter [Actinoplanes sp. KI2]
MSRPNVLSTSPVVPAVSPLLLPTVLTGVFITILDFFIVNVAIPTIHADLRAGPAAIEWIVAGYGLAYGCGLVLGGRLGDVFGRRRVYATGLALFTAASLACGLAGSPGALITARIAQGLAAALLAPQVLAVIRTAYAGARQAAAIGRYALTAGIAAVLGQLVGGVLIEATGDWRACFLINVPVGIAAFALTLRHVPESRASAGVRLDLGGAGLITLGLAALLLPLIEGRERGWPAWTWVSLGAAVALLLAYARRSHPHPLIAPAVFRERAVTVGLVAQLTFTMTMAAYFLIFALWAQQGRGLDALEAGLLFTPIGVGYVAASLRAPWFTARFGRQTIALGGLTRAAALLLLLALVAAGAPLGALAPVLAVDGFGMGLAFAPIVGTVLARVAPQHAGQVAGVLTTTQQVGGALGVGIIGVVYFQALDSGPAHAFEHGLLYLVPVSLLLAAVVQLLPGKR